MKISDLLLQDLVTLDRMNPCYDKMPGDPAFVVGEDGTSILLVTSPPRVFVPMIEGLDADAATLALLKAAAEQGSVGIEWEGSFGPIQEHFNHTGLPLDVVLKHPDGPPLVPPQGVRTIEAVGVEPDRFYCLTTSEQFGRRPVRNGLTINGVRCPDSAGLLIFNAKGVLTVFLEPGQRKFAIPSQS